MDLVENELVDNGKAKRFEMAIDNEVAFVDYVFSTAGEIFLTHTEVPKALEGKGIGSAIMLKTMQAIEEKNLRLIPMCPFVATYIKRHPEWKRLVMK